MEPAVPIMDRWTHPSLCMDQTISALVRLTGSTTCLTSLIFIVTAVPRKIRVGYIMKCILPGTAVTIIHQIDQIGCALCALGDIYFDPCNLLDMSTDR